VKRFTHVKNYKHGDGAKLWHEIISILR
jgi:hypothetical protein